MADEERAARDGFRPDFAGAEPRFAADTDGPVLHVPMLRGDGSVLGRLWASRDGAAAGFLPAPGPAGLNAKGAWVRRLILARAQGLDALGALARWTGAPQDDRAGAVPPGSVPEHADRLLGIPPPDPGGARDTEVTDGDERK
ncbi:hypothetical protein [Nocardiopsis dassonvillei]|uniref:hypothetical protein n=1 Tax=Nocardiopsis dassonvillei TaxID=2014 RepID=UPI0033FB11F0